MYSSVWNYQPPDEVLLWEWKYLRNKLIISISQLPRVSLLLYQISWILAPFLVDRRAYSAAHLMVSLFLCSSRSNAQGEVKGPWSALLLSSKSPSKVKTKRRPFLSYCLWHHCLWAYLDDISPVPVVQRTVKIIHQMGDTLFVLSIVLSLQSHMHASSEYRAYHQPSAAEYCGVINILPLPSYCYRWDSSFLRPTFSTNASECRKWQPR